MERVTANSRNLDVLRSFAVTLVVAFHLAKFFNWRPGTFRLTDFGLLGVMLFFVHTTLVLMFSLERQQARYGKPLFVPFVVRRCFRIYPLAILVVAFAFACRIPSDLQFGGFHLFHQSTANVLANLFLVQNVTLQKANPGILWSLPLELQMYLALPALFLLASRVKSWWGMIALWWLAAGLWYALGFSTGMLPLSPGTIRSPAEAFLKFTRFVPCFLPGIVAYKLWRLPKFLPASVWPLFLALSCAAFLWNSGSQPIQAGWFICLAIGAGVSFFREAPNNWLARLAQQIARYSYGIYLLHYFAIWVGFVVCRRSNIAVQIAVFIAALCSFSVLLYHVVEAPLIAIGLQIAEKWRRRSRAAEGKGFAAEPTPQIRAAFGRSS